ncbi:hypothetical protein KSP39_PZI023698 [Platanthera zijinensis]|uniref:Uncharacterized protein n=1 Tax=Platanthera zijinensis TaxID=2320716 RepID=A0AAP0ATL3_9ASPA
MDPHPTPFPGKRRPAANLAVKNETDQPKPSASLAQSKPKRAFGRNLSGNITIERPSQKPIPSKPWKPSGISKNPINPQKKVSSALPVAGGAKSGSGVKNHHVTFRDLPPPSAAVDSLPSTPVFLEDSSMQETPYQSAENCSKCRLDRLETSPYWLSQIKFAETSGKHFVSAAFFRLALDCKAQPFVSLQNELKHYRDRHAVIFKENLWGDLWLEYGLPSDQTAIIEQLDSRVTIGEGGDCTDDTDIIEKSETNLDDFEAKINAAEEIVLEKRFDDGAQEVSSSMDSPLRDIQKYENLNFNSVVRSNVVRKKSKFGGVAINDSAMDARVNKANISAEKSGQAGIKSHGGGSVGKKETGDMLRSSDLFKKESKAEEQWTSTLQDEENLNGGQNEAFNQALRCSSSQAE